MERKFVNTAHLLSAAFFIFCASALLPRAAWGQSRETIGEGDSIRVTVFQVPDLTTEARVSERGAITFPLIGEIVIAGLSPADAEARIAERLAKRSEEHTSELQSRQYLVCRLLLDKKKTSTSN